MIIENEGHQIYLWKLLCRLKFKEMDEDELSELEQSPFGGQILEELMTHSTNKFVPKDMGLVVKPVTDLILKRVAKWPETSKSVARQWNDQQVKNYLVSMIMPYKHTDDIIARLTIEFKERIKIN